MRSNKPSWFRETPHRWPNDLLPLAYALACVEVVAEKSEKAGKIYQQIIEGWGNPEFQGFFDTVNSEISDSDKENVKQALIHPETFLLTDPNAPFKQLEDLFAEINLFYPFVVTYYSENSTGGPLFQHSTSLRPP